LNDPRRLFRYVLAFAGLQTTLYAVTGLIGVAVTTFALSNNVFMGSDDARIRASLYLVELIVGLPVWLVSWSLSQRRAGASAEERNSRARRLFLGVVFAVASIVAMYALNAVLSYYLTLPSTEINGRTVRDAMFSASRVVVFGAA